MDFRARRLAALLALVGLALLGLADLALGQAGGGSSGFGGGGGSSGGGSSGGGSSGGGSSFSGGGGSSGSGSGGGSPVVVAIFFAVFGAFFVWFMISSARYAKKVRRRDERVRTASAEAAEDDAYLAAEAVEREARELFANAQLAWDRRDRAQLARLVGDDLLVEWERRLDDFDRKGWHNRVEVTDTPEIRYVELVNREDDTQDRVVVRITSTLRSFVVDRYGRKIMLKGSKSEIMRLYQYWTLARRDEGWVVASIEERAEGDHHLESEIVAVPWADERLADESLTELAVEDGLPEGFTTADLAELDFEGDARAHALDLSLADARFAPDVLEAAARRAVAAWAEAVDGDDGPLERAVAPGAVRELLYGGDADARTRLVVRGPRVRRIRIAAVDVDSSPATMTVELELGGRRYVEDRDTAAVVSGSRDAASSFTERWTLALDGPADAPWRVVEAGAARTA